MSSEPVRTCVGCRRRGPAETMLRVVVAAGTLVPDPRRRLPGRGAWVHRDQACVELAQRRRAFVRALRVSGAIDQAAVGEYVATVHHGSTPVRDGASSPRTTSAAAPDPRNPAGDDER